MVKISSGRPQKVHLPILLVQSTFVLTLIDSNKKIVFCRKLPVVTGITYMLQPARNTSCPKNWENMKNLCKFVVTITHVTGKP